MRILMLNYEYPPIGGGTGNANKYLLDRMANIENVQIDLVTSSVSEYREDNFSENIDIYRVDVGKDKIHHWKETEILRYMWKGYFKSRELQEENHYDLIHAWTGFPCGLMAKVLGKDYLVALRGSDVPGYNSRFSLQYIVLKPIIKSVWRSAEEIIPNSKGLKDLAEETLQTEMKVIPNGVDTSKFGPKYDHTDEIKVLTVARLIERKRVQDLIKAVQNLPVQLEIIGDGEKRAELEKLVKSLNLTDKVEFKGKLDHEKLPKHYSNADIFALPSLNEGMSNTVLEAMASGLPIITTQTGGTKELVGKNGDIIQKKSPEDIEKVLKKYINDKSLLKKKGRISRKKAEEMSWKNAAKQYVAKYRSII